MNINNLNYHILKKIIFFLVAVIFATSSISISTYAQETGTFTDSRDKHVYKTIKIGNQIWMAENLAYETFNGCWEYIFMKNYVSIYGKLYNWEAAKIACPIGWHLPSDAEWTALIDNIGGLDSAGCKLKSTSGLWKSPNICADNTSGFAALPAGARLPEGLFYGLETYAYFWTSTHNGNENAWRRNLEYKFREMVRDDHNIAYGGSVRCVKD